MHFYGKDLNEPKHHFLVKKREDAGIKHLHNPKAFIKHSYMDDAYNNISDYSKLELSLMT